MFSRCGIVKLVALVCSLDNGIYITYVIATSHTRYLNMLDNCLLYSRTNGMIFLYNWGERERAPTLLMSMEILYVRAYVRAYVRTYVVYLV